MGRRAGSPRSGAGVWAGEVAWLQPFFVCVNFYLDWFVVSHCCLLTSYPGEDF